MLRLLWFILVVYLIVKLFYRVMGTQSPNAGAPKPGGQKAGAFSPKKSATGVIDEMVPCAFCATYNPARQALEKKGLYFCNEQCHEAFEKRGTS